MSHKTYNRTIKIGIVIGLAIVIFATWYIHVFKGYTLYFAGL